jgi:hypothetical protein
MGIATTRENERVAASVGQLQEAAPLFEQAHNVCQAGVLFLLPALLSQGLLKGQEIYGSLKKGYYGLVSTLLFLAYMALSRIKTPEQLKSCKPGEFGKIMGLDRVPEAKCLRTKIQQIVSQEKAQEFNRLLSRQWIESEGSAYFYIDGHVRIYHGSQANLTKKYVSRQKLCLAGTTEFWLNNEFGAPYLVVTGELNEKLKDVILEKLIPILLEDTSDLFPEEQLAQDPRRPRFTLIFDREAYAPAFFKFLWEKYRIAVITYRKGVKDKWPSTDFHEHKARVIGKEVTMQLAEKRVMLFEMEMREIRKQSESGHQTSIVTTNELIPIETVAGKMFSRWSQENFFKYMLQDYALDKMVEYGVETIEPQKRVVNPCYKKLSGDIKILREKQHRLMARFYKIIEQNLDGTLEQVQDKLLEQAELQEKLNAYKVTIDDKLKARKEVSYYIELKDMPSETRYNRLKTESKLFINTIKMIAYRAETAVANILVPYFRKSEDEVRMLVKEIIKTDADLIPDYENKTLTVRLHPLSTPRANRAARKLAEFLTETEAVYPNTDLTLIYKML